MYEIEKDLADKVTRRVAETTLWWGGYVSTVWLGLDRSRWGGPPLIFETIIFLDSDLEVDVDLDRYSTEAQAVQGHAAMVKKWRFPIWFLLKTLFSFGRNL